MSVVPATSSSTSNAAPATAPAGALPHIALSRQQWILLALIALEVVVFSMVSRRFLSFDNLLQTARINVELGLVALALTPVIVSGGIDLSVGSTLGLCAIAFGKLTRDLGVPVPIAAAVTLLLGVACGGLNAALIARLRIAPLIVTLGSFSLYRGIAEGVTSGVANYTNFPAGFLRLGQGTIGGVPVQLIALAVAAAFFWVVLHRSTLGRSLSAIGFAPEGARYAGLAVDRHVSMAYILSGLCAAIAALVYVARVGQAKADAGSGYELSAITAVVLGGTSIFGGRGSIAGTLMGLAAIALLENGLRLADLPPELAGVLKGLLLLVAIGVDWQPKSRTATSIANTSNATTEEFEMKNGQLAVLCAVILAAALIVTAGNFFLLRDLKQQQPRASAAAPNASEPAPQRSLTIAMMPKNKGNAYFIACRKGAEEAAKELGANLLWDGPNETEPAKQNEIVETWITRGVDVIAVSVENRAGLSTALRKAREHGIKVITFDADAEPDARDFFVNQATAQGIGNTLMDNAAKVLGGESGEFAIITASITSANQNEWMKFIELRRAQKYPNIRQATVRPCDDIQAKAFDEARTILNAYPNVKLIMAICSPAVPGAAEAVKQAGRSDVKVIGLGLPNDNKPYVHEGVTPAVVLWNTMDLGYLTVRTADALARGQLNPGDAALKAGRLGTIEVRGDNVLLGTPFTFTKDNIDQFDF